MKTTKIILNILFWNLKENNNNNNNNNNNMCA